jgi:outer membrane receptor protein involved in Fe transport
MQFLLKPFSFVLFCIFSFCTVSLTSADTSIEEIIVSSDFREAQLKNIPTSISVINSEVISQRNSRHLEDVLALTPNVNFSAGASRGKYFQIRGIGERSQFKDPLYSSVGAYLDGIDFTGLGGAATLLDIDQVEVLRGSQGTRFGANALAGVINLKSVDPTNETQGHLKTSVTSYNGISLETAAGGAVNDQWLYRLAVGKTLSDGFIENTTLDRKDTNNIDELTSRLKLRYLVSDKLIIDFTALHLDIDNGYDAFSLDENLTTMSNQPGHDRQKSKAIAINSQWDKSDVLSINTIITSNRSDIEYGYDEDWSYKNLWVTHAGYDYTVFDNYLRDISRDSAEVRLVSGSAGKIFNSDWLFGIYKQKSTEDGTQNRTGDTAFNYQYESNSNSVYAQLNTPLTANLSLTSGLRYEDWQSKYSNTVQINGKNDESLVGGKLALELTNQADDLVYLSLTKGYKAGGFNTEKDLPTELIRRFKTEYQWNYEAGVKFSPSNKLVNNHISFFYTDRKNLHLKSSMQESDGSWTDYVTNAGKGYSYGLEWQLTWEVLDDVLVTSSLGLLKTKISEHNNPNPNAFNLNGRAVAHAPEYNFATSAKYTFTEKLSATIEVEGKDKFYYSDSHNYKSKAYTLINARIAYISNNYELTAFVNNVANKDYGVRGFDFSIWDWDQDPRSGEGYDELEYQQLGSPKVVGVSVRADF